MFVKSKKIIFTLAKDEQNTQVRFYTQATAKYAFTLAEILITLAVIGIVAALTLPGLIRNHNEKAWSTAKDLWDKKLVEVTRRMNVDGVMTGVASSTEEFMNYFKNYVKVIKICENNKLSDCYATKLIQTEGDDVLVSDLKTAYQLGQKSWQTNTIGFVIADGTTVVMAYNPNCSSVDPFSQEGQNGQVGCMSMLVDVNGKKAPNKVGKDIDLKNAVISTCDIKFGDICMAASNLASDEPLNTCDGSDNLIWDDRGSANQYCTTNYWAGAKKLCNDIGMRLPTVQELADIATYIYKQDDNPIGVNDLYRYNLTPDQERCSELNWAARGGAYWTNQSISTDSAITRTFFPSSFEYYDSGEVYMKEYSTRCFGD